MIKKTKKVKIKKSKKKVKMIGGEPIEEGDIMYRDELVCILKPYVKKGIIVWTNYTQPPYMDTLCNLGLKTGQQLQSEGVDFGRSKIHPYIFFRAPYYARYIDYSTPETEIISSYGEGVSRTESRVFIRVDPDRTFVFSSEIRVKWFGEEYMLNYSKKTLSKYLEIINDNIRVERRQLPKNINLKYDLFSSKAQLVPDSIEEKQFDIYPINRNSEILVSIPHLTPDFFVFCNP
jgi:hypothetical protein